MDKITQEASKQQYFDKNQINLLQRINQLKGKRKIKRNEQKIEKYQKLIEDKNNNKLRVNSQNIEKKSQAEEKDLNLRKDSNMVQKLQKSNNQIKQCGTNLINQEEKSQLKRSLNQRVKQQQNIQKDCLKIQIKSNKKKIQKTKNIKDYILINNSSDEQVQRKIQIQQSSNIQQTMAQSQIQSKQVRKQIQNKFTEINQKYKEQNQVISIKKIFNSNQKFDYINFSSEIFFNFEKLVKQLKQSNKKQDEICQKNLMRSNYISVNKGIMIHFLIQKLIIKQKIQNEGQRYKFWMFKGTLKQFKQLLISHIKNNTKKQIQSNKLMQLKRLWESFNLGHLLSASSNLMFIIEKIITYPILKYPIKACSFCKQPFHYYCLCNKFAQCTKQSCNQRSQMKNYIREHNLRCKYTSYQNMYQNYKIVPKSHRGKVGLFNPQNYCFMNTALQCLAACKPLTQYFIEKKYLKHLNTTNEFGTFGQIATRYGQFLNLIWTTSNQFLKIQKLRKSICKWDNKYFQNQQEDSQQFLSQFLDWLKQDLNLNQSKPVYKQQKQNNLISEYKAEQAWKNHLERNNSIIEYLMAGLLKSTIKCKQCEYQSNNFQTFLTLPLPIANIERQKHQNVQIKVSFVHKNFNQQNKLLKLYLHHSSSSQITQIIKKQLNLSNKSSLIGISVGKTQGANFLKTNQQINIQLEKARLNHNNFISLGFLQYKKQQLQHYKIQILFGIKIKQNDKIFLCSYPRLFFYKNQQHLTARNIYKSYLKYFYNVMFRYKQEVSKQEYFIKYLNKENLPFKVFFINGEELELQSDRKIANKSVIYALLPNDNVFNYKKLSIASNHINIFNKQTYNNRRINIYDNFTKFQQPQIMDLDNRWLCPKCKTKRVAYKKISIYKAPKILIVFFKRFATTQITQFGYKNMISKKIQTFIQFPHVLDLNKYVQKKQLPYTNQILQAKYNLFAVANHITLNSQGEDSGHYTAHVLHRDEWYLINDQQIKKVVDVNSVVSKNAYILFYSRIE